MKFRGSLLAGLFLLAVSFAQAQQTGDRYVFVISKINYLKAINDAVSASEDNGLTIREVRVILCGESVKAFQEDNPLVRKALATERIRLFACGLSLEQMKVDRSVLPAGVETVRNGILEGMVLEKKGYKLMDL